MVLQGIEDLMFIVTAPADLSGFLFHSFSVLNVGVSNSTTCSLNYKFLLLANKNINKQINREKNDYTKEQG